MSQYLRMNTLIEDVIEMHWFLMESVRKPSVSHQSLYIHTIFVHNLNNWLIWQRFDNLIHEDEKKKTQYKTIMKKCIDRKFIRLNNIFIIQYLGTLRFILFIWLLSFATGHHWDNGNFPHRFLCWLSICNQERYKNIVSVNTRVPRTRCHQSFHGQTNTINT